MAPNALAIHVVAFRLLCHTAIELPAWILGKKKTLKKFHLLQAQSLVPLHPVSCLYHCASWLPMLATIKIIVIVKQISIAMQLSMAFCCNCNWNVSIAIATAMLVLQLQHIFSKKKIQQMAPNALAIHAVAFRLICHTAIELPAWILGKKKH